MRKMTWALLASILVSHPVLSFSQPTNLYTFSGDVDLGLDYTVFISSGLHYIGAKGDTVYVVTSNGGTWCSKSTDGGQSFGSPVRVNSTSAGYNPSMRVDTAGIIYVAYQDEYADIRFSKSTDGGMTFTSGVKVNDDTIPQTGQEKPAIAVNNKGQIFIAWRDQRNSAPQTHQTVFAAASYDRGVTFAPNIQVNDTGASLSGSIDIGADDSAHVYVVWIPDRRGIFLSRSNDSGLTFPFRSDVSDFPTDSNFAGGAFPSIAIGNDTVSVAWGDRRFDQWTLRFSVSFDYGQTFSPSVRVDDDADLSSSTAPVGPSLVWQKGLFYVTWADVRIRPSDSQIVYNIFFSYSVDGGQSFLPNVDINAYDTTRPDRGAASLAINGQGKAFVAWFDNRFDPYFGENWHTFVAYGVPNAIKGDLNLDGVLTPVDAVMEINAVFLESPFPAPMESADTNCDFQLTAADVVLLMKRVFLEEALPCN